MDPRRIGMNELRIRLKDLFALFARKSFKDVRMCLVLRALLAPVSYQ